MQQIATLKFIGLSLKQIKDVLDGRDLDLPATLSLQRRLLTDKRRQIELALRAIEEAERSVGSSRTPDWTALKKIIEVMEMQTNNEWMKKYYSDEAQAKIGQKAAKFTPEMQAEVTQQWNQLIREVESAISSKQDPADAPARELARTLGRHDARIYGSRSRDPERLEQALCGSS